jgi:hypothetical protein
MRASVSGMKCRFCIEPGDHDGCGNRDFPYCLERIAVLRSVATARQRKENRFPEDLDTPQLPRWVFWPEGIVDLAVVHHEELNVRVVHEVDEPTGDPRLPDISSHTKIVQNEFHLRDGHWRARRGSWRLCCRVELVSHATLRLGRDRVTVHFRDGGRRAGQID